MDKAILRSQGELTPTNLAAPLRGMTTIPNLHEPVETERSPRSEVLVADARGALTPTQMVEQKLAALLGQRYRRRYDQVPGGLIGVRMMSRP